MGKEEFITVIPARAGSKRVPGKNLRNLRGRPLIDHTLMYAAQVCQQGTVVVSTDSLEIAKRAKYFGFYVHVRPSALASDDALVAYSVDAVLRDMEKISSEFEFGFLLEPTTPIRRPQDFFCALDKLRAKVADSVATFSLAQVPIERLWRVNDSLIPSPFLNSALAWEASQKLSKTYYLNGALYGFSIVNFKNRSNKTSLLLHQPYALILPPKFGLTIDTIHDFYLAEQMYDW